MILKQNDQAGREQLPPVSLLVGTSPALSGGVPSDISTERAGVLTCPKTARCRSEAVSTLRDLWNPRFQSPELLNLALGGIEPAGRRVAEDFYTYTKHKDDRVAVLSVSPGSVQLSFKKLWAYDAHDLPERSNTPGEPLFSLDNEKRKISEWSRKSRANMVRRFSTLDYTPLAEQENTLPGMVTLTYPANWEVVCPDGETARKHLKAFRSRFERAWGDLYAIWKREYQRRGAPHFHLFMPIPQGKTAREVIIGGEPVQIYEDFQQWVSRSWAEIVGNPDPEEYAKHLRAGTGVDYAEGLRCSDPKRVAIYFLKAESAVSGKSSKEYQNRVPKLHREAGGVGRFWGYWGLKPAVQSVVLTERQGIELGRVLRRLSRRCTPTNETYTKKSAVSGEYVTRHRFKKREFFKHNAGFLCVNDGVLTGMNLARILESLPPESPPLSCDPRSGDVSPATTPPNMGAWNPRIRRLLGSPRQPLSAKCRLRPFVVEKPF